MGQNGTRMHSTLSQILYSKKRKKNAYINYLARSTLKFSESSKLVGEPANSDHI